MKNNRISGAIHASMFCAFFISFLFKTDAYLLHDMVPRCHTVLATYLNAELLAFAGCMTLCLFLACVWNIKLKLRLWLISLLNIACLSLLICSYVFAAYALLTAALCTALPLAVKQEKIEPVRFFFAFTAIIIALIFPDFGIYAGLIGLITVIAQREITGIRFGGRFILAFMLLTAFLFGSFHSGNKKTVPDVTATHFRQNYELMMLAFAQYGAIPRNSVCYFNHPWQNMHDLSAIVTKLSVDKNENMNAYFAGDQLRYPAEHELSLRGKRIPALTADYFNPRLKPAVIMIAYPATGDYHLAEKGSHFPYYGDAWRNYSFYSVEGIEKLKGKLSKNGVFALQLPADHQKAAPLIAAVKQVFKHSIILRWSGVYLFASDRKLTADPDFLDQNAVAAGIYKYMYAPYRIILFALTTYHDEAGDARLLQSADNVSPLSLHDLPRINNARNNNSVIYADIIFRSVCSWGAWLLPLLFILYCFARYWFTGVPGAKLPFLSFETGLLTGIMALLPLLAYSLLNNIPLLILMSGSIPVLFVSSAMITLLFVHSRNADSFFVKTLMLVLCVCACFFCDISKTMLCCIVLLAGVASVCIGHCTERCSVKSWFLGMAAACLLTPVIWYTGTWALYSTGCVIICYILFAGNKNVVTESE